MIKHSLVAVIFFVLGVCAAVLYQSVYSPFQTNPQVPMFVDTDSSQAVAVSVKQQVQNTALSEKPVAKLAQVNLSIFNSAKTPFEFFEILSSLENARAEELKHYLISLGPDKLEARRQVAWLFAGRYPKEALDFLTRLTARSDVELSKLILQYVGQNHAALAWDWMKSNDSEMDKIFLGSVASVYDFKLFVLKWLSLVPEQKWIAYEEVKSLTANGPRKGDKNGLLSVASNAAKSDPDDAINRALSGVNAERDPYLFNGALTSMLEKDASKARSLALQNQDMTEVATFGAIAAKLMSESKLTEAADLIKDIKNSEKKQSVYQSFASLIVRSYPERIREFVQSIDLDWRSDAVGLLSISIDAAGYSVKERLSLMDSSLQDAGVSTKVFGYAYAMRDWAKAEPSEFNAYMAELRSRDKSLADEIEKTLQLFKK